MAPLDPYTDTTDNAADYSGSAGYDAITANDPSGGGATARTPTPSAPKPAAAAASSDGWTDVPNSVKPVQATLTAADLAKEPDPIVRMLVLGDYDPMLMRRFDSDKQKSILNRAQQYDPSLDLSNYPAKAQAKKAFTSGKAADAIRSINQFIGHANSLADAEKSLNNSDGWFPTPVNWTENFVGSQFSPDLRERLGKFTPIKTAVGNEFENMVRGSSVSGVKERLENLQSLSEDSAPSAIKGWIDGALQVMNSRLNELQDQYKQGTGLQYGLDVLNPKSKSILKRFGVTSEGGGTGTGAGTGAGGKQLDPTTAQQFLQQAGGNKDKARGLARAAGYTF